MAHSRTTTRLMVSRWHSTHRAPIGWKVAFLLLTDGAGWDDLREQRILGVSTWGRPVARAEDQIGTLEHTRMALSPSAPKNSASWFISANRRWIREHMPQVRRLISYVDETDHLGVTYRADNWHIVYRRQPSSGSWQSRPGREGRACVLRTKFERTP